MAAAEQEEEDEGGGGLVPDLYQLPGVPLGASGGEITRAWRQRAAAEHPDRRPRDAAAPARFRALTGACRVLGDPARRAARDRSRGDQPGPGAAAPGGPAARAPARRPHGNWMACSTPAASRCTSTSPIPASRNGPGHTSAWTGRRRDGNGSPRSSSASAARRRRGSASRFSWLWASATEAARRAAAGSMIFGATLRLRLDTSRRTCSPQSKPSPRSSSRCTDKERPR
jgi:curved DNA-binding protein CbpA